MTAVRFHRWNAVFLSGFLILHFATHVSGLFGIDAYNQTQSVLRLVYKNPIVEPFLLASIMVQVGWGLVLLIRRFRRGIRGVWAHTQVYSGVLFFVFVVQHLSAFAMARWIEGMDTNFYWPASVMSGAPFVWYFAPYYLIGVAALFVHAGCGIRLALLRSRYRASASTGFWISAFTGTILSSLIVAMLLGSFYEIELPEVWTAYLQAFVPSYMP